MKKILFFFIFILFIFIGNIIIFDYPKKFISRLIFSHELSLLTHSVFYAINDKIDFEMTDKENQKKSLVVLNNYVYNFFRPEFKNLDDGVSWKMLHGSIWCDGVADIFLRLSENINTKVHMVYLYQNDGIASHTLNFVELENFNKKNKTKFNNMYLFDPHYNYYPVNRKNQFVNVDYMLRNKKEFTNYKMLNSDNIKLRMLENDKRIFITNRSYEEYSILGKISLKIVKYVPKNIIKMIYKFGIFINPTLKDDYKKFLYARLNHILLDYDKALINYSLITNKNIYFKNAQFWKDRIKSSTSKINNYDEIMSSIKN